MLFRALLSLAASLLLTDALQEHRIFPAASFERYSAENNGILRTVLPDDFDVVFSEATDEMNAFLQAAKDRFLKSFFILPDYPLDSPKNPQNLTLVPLKRLVLSVTSNSTMLYHGVDESYSLRIENASSTDAFLNATTVYGILRGLETFAQLLKFEWMKDDTGIFSLPQSMWIADAPEYPYRGLLIDTSRHYLPLPLIMANLEAMAINKLNVLHWHMTDSPSFPYRSLRYPELAEKGAFHPKRIYTPEDIQLVVKEAKLRGIRVVPEFDLPSHSKAIAKSHPELMTRCPDKPSEPLDPTQPAVYEFLDNLYSEITHVFPEQFVHVGGDEVSFKCWRNSSSIQHWMKQRGMMNETSLYAYFEKKLLSLVCTKYNKTAIVWQEAYNLGLPLENDTIIDVWKSKDNTTISQATFQGHQVIVSSCWYLDDLSKGWNDFYKCLPRNFTGSTQQKSLVIGGKASMWGERVDATNFMQRVWPRASAVAERLWTGSTKSAEASVEERITKFRCHMVKQGIAAEPIFTGCCCDREPEYVHEKKKTRGLPLGGAVEATTD